MPDFTKDEIRQCVYADWDYFGTMYEKRSIGWISAGAAINAYFLDQERFADDLFTVGKLRKEMLGKQAIENGERNRTYRNTMDSESRAMLDGISELYKEGHSPDVIVAMMQLSEASLPAVRRHVGLDPIPYDDGKRSPVQIANPVIAEALKRIGKPMQSAQPQPEPQYMPEDQVELHRKAKPAAAQGNHGHIDLRRYDTDPRG